jgi:hypothetical protein
MSHGGKGSSPRPFSVDQKTFTDNWDAIFGQKKKSEGEKQAEAWLKDEYYDLDSQNSDTPPTNNE